jgi:hypothetical protein
VGVLIWMGKWHQMWPRHDNSDWRSAARAEERLASSSATPVVCLSPFIESLGPGWRPDYHLPGFLYAHLSIYPIRGVPYLLPFQDSPRAERYAEQLAAEKLAPSGQFVLYGPAGMVRYWDRWFSKRPEFAGWESATEVYGDVAAGLLIRRNPGDGKGTVKY